ncbi:NACHT domain-containing protein [Nonomuraea typhae]|uniref:NACHT domain-containing protein n=1 Tax=Nonomuraea typhae TaxID=2603600 RepID=UPI0012FA52C8|nr:AAA family ATPase [Nonomuraea typhae]
MDADTAALVVSIVSLLVAGGAAAWDAFTHSHGREEAFRRYSGKTVVAAGALSAVFGVVAWLAGSEAPIWPVLCLAVLITAYGGARALRAYPEEIQDLHRIAGAAMELTEAGAPHPSGLAARYVDAGRRLARHRPAGRQLLRAGAKVSFLVGDMGAGKTTTLRHTATLHARRTRDRRRRPRTFVLYVDLSGYDAADLTVDLLRGHLRTTLTRADSDLEAVLARVLRPLRRPQVTFLIDGVDDVETALPVLRRFLSTGHSYRGVIAAREEPPAERAERVLRLLPLSFAQQSWLAGRRGLDQDRFFAGDTELAQHTGNPLHLSLFLDVAADGRPPSTLHDLMERTVAARLGGDMAGLVTTAEALAAHAIGGIAIAPDVLHDADVATLTALGILRPAQTAAPVFVTPLLADHFAARWLLRTGHRLGAADLREVLTNPAWERAAATCLRASGPDLRASGSDLRERLLGAACDALGDHLAAATWAIPDPVPYMSTPQQGAASHPRMPYSWPAPMRQILRVLGQASTDRQPIAPRLSELVDRIIVSAFARGTATEQRRAAALLPLASPEVGAWTVTRLTARKGPWDVDPELVGLAQTVFPTLPPPTRLRLLGTALLSAPTLNRLVPGPAARPGAAGLAPALRATLRVLQALSVVFLGTMVDGAVRGFPENAVLFGALALLSGLFLIASGGVPMRRIRDGMYIGALAPVLLGAFWSTAGFVLAGQALFALLTGSPVEAVNLAARTLILTWPIALVLHLACAGRVPDRPLDWILPHLRPVTDLARHYGRPRITFPAPSARRLRAVLLQAGIVVPVVAAGVFVQVTYEVWSTPMQVGMGVAVFLAFLAVNVVIMRRKEANRWRDVAARVRAGSLTPEHLLDLLEQAGTRDHRRRWGAARLKTVARLLTTLESAGPAALKHVAPVLADLEAAVAHITRYVNTDSSQTVPLGVWELAPAFRHPGFLDWIKQFDARFPGLLIQLSALHHATLVRIVPGC